MLMKKTIFTILFIAAAFSITAQKISIGPTAGFGHSWLTNYNSVDVRFNPSWNAGISFIYSTKKNFGFGADVKYSVEGNKINYIGIGPADGPVTVTRTSYLNYIRVPLKFIYFFGKHTNVIRPKLYAGPSFGFLTGGHIVEEESGTKYKSDSKDYYKSFDVGFTAAAGLNFRLAPATWLNTDVAYYNGFPNISKTNSNNYNKNTYNRNVQINISLLVGLKKK